MNGLSFFTRAYPDISKQKSEVSGGKKNDQAKTNRQPSFKSFTAGPAKVASHNSSLPENPAKAASQRTDLIFPEYAPLPDDQRGRLSETQKQATQPHISALVKTKAALEIGLNVTRPELMKIKGKKEHAAAYKLWRDSTPGSPNYDKISEAGKAGVKKNSCAKWARKQCYVRSFARNRIRKIFLSFFRMLS